eukprot:TRINITY_DN2548_c0_g1_i5.p1 TRINITY_DN2548_c0_g1~~TRINITY_DN2548_c0_g1_i5.p1  ORF type:complete len:283 (-),score=48.79 TRINITY_DN2548_c0_g1_i5:43-891(-)
MSIQTVSEMFVDINRGGEKLHVNVDIIAPKLPCSLLSLDVEDVTGSHILNVGGELKKRKLDKNGAFISQEIYQENMNPDIKETVEGFKNGEGCQVFGYILVNKVPGNFHISCHAFGPQLQAIVAETGINTIDVSHQINHISFGSDDDLKAIKSKFNVGVLNPLDGVKKIKPEHLNTTGVTHQYYLSVVPTTYTDLGGRDYFVYQFTSNSNEMNTAGLPVLVFRFDLSPVTVKFSQRRESISHFLVQICAIIGGIFTVAGIVDSLIHKSVRKLLKKAQEGKLS